MWEDGNEFNNTASNISYEVMKAKQLLLSYYIHKPNWYLMILTSHLIFLKD